MFVEKIRQNPVRVKGGKSLRNGMWNGGRKGIIMRNTIYAVYKLTEERVMFSRQFYKSSSFFDAADSWSILTTIRGFDRLIVDLEEVRVKKTMKTVYSFCIQETMSKSVVN